MFPKEPLEQRETTGHQHCEKSKAGGEGLGDIHSDRMERSLQYPSYRLLRLS